MAINGGINIYDKLLELPLFKGMNHADLSEIVAHIKFGFHKYNEGKTVINEGDVCNYLCFLISGKMKATAVSDDHSYTFIEEMATPCVIQAERIYGLIPRFTRTFTADTACSVITIDKMELEKLTNNYEIFRFNIINMISTQLQRNERMLWRAHPEDIRMRVIRFIEMRCMRPAGEKCILIKQERLAKELNSNRLAISRMINKMQEQGLVSLKRGEIHIPAIEKLLM